MIFSNTAVRSLSSLLVVAVVAATTSVVGSATTTKRKLSKNNPQPPSPRCPTATLYWPTAFNNTIGSQHIQQIFRANAPIGPPGEERLCVLDDLGRSVCIGDTVTWFHDLYSDMSLTTRVGSQGGMIKFVEIRESGKIGYLVTASIVYDDTGSELNYGGYFHEQEFLEPGGQDMAVSGGTGDCVMHIGAIGYTRDPNSAVGSINFDIMDMRVRNH